MLRRRLIRRFRRGYRITRDGLIKNDNGLIINKGEKAKCITPESGMQDHCGAGYLTITMPEPPVFNCTPPPPVFAAAF